MTLSVVCLLCLMTVCSCTHSLPYGTLYDETTNFCESENAIIATIGSVETGPFPATRHFENPADQGGHSPTPSNVYQNGYYNYPVPTAPPTVYIHTVTLHQSLKWYNRTDIRYRFGTKELGEDFKVYASGGRCDKKIEVADFYLGITNITRDTYLITGVIEKRMFWLQMCSPPVAWKDLSMAFRMNLLSGSVDCAPRTQMVLNSDTGVKYQTFPKFDQFGKGK